MIGLRILEPGVFDIQPNYPCSLVQVKAGHMLKFKSEFDMQIRFFLIIMILIFICIASSSPSLKLSTQRNGTGKAGGRSGQFSFRTVSLFGIIVVSI